MNKYAVIMAGGKGKRFWPLSNDKTPKQLLNLSGKEIMVNETIIRLNKVIDKKDIYIVTNTSQFYQMTEVTKPYIASNNIIVEPLGRNTAPCIALACFKLIKEKGDGVIVVSPSDAYIKNETEYARVISLAVDYASDNDTIVTLGIKPDRPATGYGYIKFVPGEHEIHDVEKFTEKPVLDLAKIYVSSREYLWNSGVFIFRVSYMLDLFKKHLPDIYEELNNIKDQLGTSAEFESVKYAYSNIKGISIDYGIIEKCSSIKVIKSDIGWSDVGSWDSLSSVLKEDENGNIIKGECLNIDTKNTTIFANKKLIATIGLDNIVIVETDDAILVCDKSRSQEVEKIVNKLEENK